MNSKLLKEFKEEYLKRREENERTIKGYNAVKKRRDLIKNNSLVVQFLEYEKQLSQMRKNIYSDEELLVSSFDDCISSFDEKTDKIYFYLGSFCIDERGNNFQVERRFSDEFFGFNTYIDIESKKVIDICDWEEFERDNKVIITSDYPDIEMFNEIRKTFLENLVKDGEDVAYKKVLKKKY